MRLSPIPLMIDDLKVAFDGRYMIEELLDILEEAIQDFEAQAGLRMAARLNDVVKRVAKQVNRIFSTIAGIIAVTPIPVADLYVLLVLQAILVSLVASLSGRDLSLDTAKEFILSLGGVVGAGYTFRFIAQQGTKLVNAFWPGVGSALSAGIAASGTLAIGKAAILYYIDGKDFAEAKAKFEEARKEKFKDKVEIIKDGNSIEDKNTDKESDDK